MDALERRINQQEIEQAYIMFLEENDIFIKWEISYEYWLYLAAKRFSANWFWLNEITELWKNLLENLNNWLIITIDGWKINKWPYFKKNLQEEKFGYFWFIRSRKRKTFKNTFIKNFIKNLFKKFYKYDSVFI